jgi:hypothetical protein
METACERDVSNLRNWVDTTASIARDETDYLSHNRDLIAAGGSSAEVPTLLQHLIEDAMIWASKVLRLRKVF